MVLSSKNASLSTRPSTAVDKENLPSIDKPHRPSTIVTGNSSIHEHSMNNGTVTNAGTIGASNTTTPTNGLPTTILASGSIDASTVNTSGYSALKSNASGGPSVVNSNVTRSNVVGKLRAETVRLPNHSNASGREQMDRSNNNGNEAVKKLDSIHSSDRVKSTTTNGSERYVEIPPFYFVLFVH